MLSFTKTFIEDLVADKVRGVNVNSAKECIFEIEKAQDKAKLSKRLGLSTMKVIPVTKKDKNLVCLLGENYEHIVTANTLNNEETLTYLSAIDKEAVQSGICDVFLLVKTW